MAHIIGLTTRSDSGSIQVHRMHDHKLDRKASSLGFFSVLPIHRHRPSYRTFSVITPLEGRSLKHSRLSMSNAHARTAIARLGRSFTFELHLSVNEVFARDSWLHAHRAGYNMA